MKKVIIIGTGIVGVTTAYELARLGADVTMIDQEAKGRATAAAAGMISPWMTKRRNKDWYELAKNGAKYYDSLNHNLRTDGFTDTGYKRVGAIKLNKDYDKLAELEQIVADKKMNAAEIGEIKLLNKSETKEMLPLLNEDYYSLFISGGARVDGNKLQQSLLSAAKLHGAKYVNGSASLIIVDGKAVGATVNEKEIYADEIVVTNGVWMKEFFKKYHIDLKLIIQKGEIVHLKIAGFKTDDLPVIMPPSNQYLLHFDEGKIVVGSTHEVVDQINPINSAGAIAEILQHALSLKPALSAAEILETRVGFRAYTHNHLPVFGPLPKLKNVFIANGLGASGLTTGPFIGSELAKLVLGKDPSLSLTPYDPAQIIGQ